MSRNTRIATASSVATLAAAALLVLAPTAQAKPDPGQPPPSDGGAVVREVEVPFPVDDGAFEPMQIAVAALVGAAAAAGARAGRQRLNRPQVA